MASFVSFCRNIWGANEQPFSNTLLFEEDTAEISNIFSQQIKFSSKHYESILNVCKNNVCKNRVWQKLEEVHSFITILNSVASIFWTLQRYEEAVETCKKSHGLVKETYGENIFLLPVLNSLAG